MKIKRHNFFFKRLLFLFLPILFVTCQDGSTKFATKLAPENLTNQLKIHISQDGVYEISQADLSKFGLKIDDFSIGNLSLSQAGREVPFLTSSNHLIFYAEQGGDRYVRSFPIILKTGTSGTEIQTLEVPDIRGPELSSVTQSIRLEEDLNYLSNARRTASDDVWFWEELRQQEFFETQIDVLNLIDEPAKLRINAWGVTHNDAINDDHDIDLIVNEKHRGEIVWDGQNHFTSETILASGSLQEGSNSIILDNRPEGATFLDIVQINWIELDYQSEAVATNDVIKFRSADGVSHVEGFSAEPIMIDITDKNSPSLLVGWAYEDHTAIVPTVDGKEIIMVGPDGFAAPDVIEPMNSSNWAEHNQQTDLMIISADDFIPALEPLVKTRKDQGLNVALIPLSDVFDEFGDGAPTPIALKKFITNALKNWPEPKPRYLLLVGDATTDYLGNYGEISEDLVPSMLVPVQFSGETSSDSRLVDIDDDMIPEIAVGRWPVESPEDVQSLVERTLAYENGQAANRALFAVDGSESRFATIAESIANSSQIPQEQVQIIEGSSAREITDQWNQGAWLTTYIGHGSLSRWGKDDVLNLKAVENLNTDTPPIVLQFTCLTGLFSHPQETSLSEAMLNNPDGPVMIVAATSLTLSTHQEPFAVELLKNLQDNKIERIGDAFQKAKLSLEIEKSNGLREISDTFVLLGDPSAVVLRP